MTGTAHLPTSEQARRPCPALGGPGWIPCEKAAGHLGPHYAWLSGYGPYQWPNKEAHRA